MTTPIFLARWGYQRSSELEKLISESNFNPQKHFLALPYSLLEKINQLPGHENLTLGADQLLDVEEGSFTRSIATDMLKEIASFVLLDGKDPHITQKIIEAFKTKINPFLLIGETWDQHQNQPRDILQQQIELKGLSPHQIMQLNFVYEAPWIHSAPFCPSTEEITQSYQVVKDLIYEKWGSQIGSAIKIMGAVPCDFENPLLLLPNMSGLYFPHADKNIRQFQKTV